MVTAGILSGSAELGAYITLQALHDRAPERFLPDWENYVNRIDDTEFDRFRRNYFDPLLGWSYRAGFKVERTNRAGKNWRLEIGSDGSRRNPAADLDEPIAVATYGDSFTFGEEVNDADTWQAELTRRLGVPVANFGVGGYGPGQAFLRYDTTQQQAAVVILAIYEGDLNRASNRYWPIYDNKTKLILGFKPRFKISDTGGLELIPPVPTKAIATRDELLDAIAISSQGDGWIGRRVRLEFPYILRVVQFAALLRESAFPSAWKDSQDRALLAAIIDVFQETALSRGSAPVVLFIPRVQSWRYGRREPDYAAFVEDLRVRSRDLAIVDVADASFDTERFNILPFEGHASAYGNSVIATVLIAPIKALRDQGKPLEHP